MASTAGAGTSAIGADDDKLPIVGGATKPSSSAAADNDEIDVEEDDKESFDALIAWLSGKVEILPSKIRRYSALFVQAGVGSIKRLGKKVKKIPDFLESLGIHIDDADEITEVLSREGVFETIRLEKLAAQQAEEAENRPVESQPVMTLLQTRQRASSVSTNAAPTLPDSVISSTISAGAVAVGGSTAAADSLIRSRQGTLSSENELPGYLSNPYAYTYTNDQPEDDPQAAGSAGRPRKHTSYSTRKLSDAKLDLLAAEVAELMVALKQAADGEDEIATQETLLDICDTLEGSPDKQRAFQRAFAHLGVLEAFRKLVGSTGVATCACRVIALLCRCGDDKGTTNYENCKAFGLSNVGEVIVSAFKKHADDARLVEAACDAIRSLCSLESNKQRLGEAGACEVISGAIANFSADPGLCAWICRAMGHLAQGSPANQEAFGDNLCATNLVIALQHYQKVDAVCTEIFWAIRNLAYGSQQNRSRFYADFGPESITVALSRHTHIEILAVEATLALVSLINDENDDVICRIANSGAMTFITRAMKKAPDSEALAYRAFQLFYYCGSCPNTSYGPMIKKKLTSSDFLEVVSIAFENHAGDFGTAEWGCRLLHILIDESLATYARMRNAGLCEMVVSAVQRQAISHDICNLGCQVIGDLACDVQNHDRLASAGACEAACGALRRHDDEIEVVVNACYAIHFLSLTQNNVGWIGANGGCEAVTNSLIKHTPSDIQATQYAARALGSLAFKDEGNMVRIFEAGGCAAIVVAIRTHYGDRETCEFCCRAIYHLCGDNTNVKDLGEKGACGLVVQVLVNHKTIGSVVKQACLAVNGLAVRVRTDKVHKTNTRKLIARSAVENVVECFRTYSDTHDVVRACAMAVTALSRLDENRLKVGATGVCDMLIAGLTAHAEQGDCVAKLAQAVNMLSQPILENGVIVSDVNKEKFAMAGVAEILLSLLRKHERHSEVAVEILRALITLATHAASRKFVWSDEACGLYVKVMKIHEKEEDVAEWACNMIYSQAIDNAARVRLGTAKACEGVVSVLVKHAATAPAVTRFACRAICGLAELDANKRKFATGDACNSLILALKTHVADADVCEWACFAVVSISPNQGNRHKFFIAGACPVINKVMVTHMESAMVTTLAFEAMREVSYFVDNRVHLGTVGACDSLIRSFELHIDSHEVATHACRAIAALAFQNPLNASRLGAAGACELVLRALRMHFPATALIEWAFAALSSLAERQKKNQEAFQEGGIAKLVISAILQHQHSDGVCFQAAKAVRCLCVGNDEIRLQFAQGGIAPVVLASLQKHDNSSLVVESACWVLGNVLCIEGSDSLHKISIENLDPTTAESTLSDAPSGGENAQPFSSPATPRGGIKPSPFFYSTPGHWESLVNALHTHMHKPQAARWICCALQSFADRSQTEHFRACEIVMEALATHADALSVCNKALLCIGALAHSHVKNASRLGKLRACEEAASILTRSEEEPTIHGCFAAIAGLANSSTANQSRFASIPSLSKDVVQKLYDMFEHPNVARWGCASISALTFKNHDNQSKLGQAANFIADIIEQHIKSKVIVRDALRAAACLAHNHISNRNRLGAGGCCEWTSKALSVPAFASDPTLMFWAVRGIADLAANNPNNQAKLGMHGSCEALVTCLTRTTAQGGWISAAEDERIAKYTLWAIGNVVQLGRDTALLTEGGLGMGIGSMTGIGRPTIKNTQRLGEAGAVQAVASAIAKFDNSPDVLRWACRAVNNLARSKTLRAQLNVLKVRWALEGIQTKHESDKGLKEWAAAAIDVLVNGVPLPAPPSVDKRSSGGGGGGSPRTSLAGTLSLGLGAMVGALDDSLGLGSAEKNRSKARSKSLSEREILAQEAASESKGQQQQPKASTPQPGVSPRRAVAPANNSAIAPGKQTAKTLAQLSAASSGGTMTPAQKVVKGKGIPVDTPRTSMPPSDPSTSPDAASASVEVPPTPTTLFVSEISTPLVDGKSEGR